MDVATLAQLALAGLIGGIITAIVGAASLITFPAMLAVGLPPVVATACNTVAMTPSSFVAAWVDYRRLPPWRPAFRLVLAISAVGSSIGAFLLLLTPERAFSVFVPVLIGLATVLFAGAGTVRRWLYRHGDDPALHSAHAERVGLTLLAPVSVYSGYFGAGTSVMLLAILSLGPAADFRSVNALKNLLSGLSSVVAVVIFIAGGLIVWPQTLALGAGGLAGGYVGGRLAHFVPVRAIRWLVIAVGATVTVVSAKRFW